MFSPFNTSSVMSMGSQSPFSLRIHATCHQGGRKYMEDTFCVSYQRNPISQDIDFVFFGIFDGHGGRDAAFYARDHLCENIIRERSFWSKNDDDVLHAIRRGFITTHYDMLKEVGELKIKKQLKNKQNIHLGSKSRHFSCFQVNQKLLIYP